MASVTKSVLGVMASMFLYEWTSLAKDKDVPIISVQYFTGGLGLGNVTGAEAEVNLGPGLAVGAAYVPKSKSNFGVATADAADGDESYSILAGKIERTAQMAFARFYPMNGSFHLTTLVGKGTMKYSSHLEDEGNNVEVHYHGYRDQLVGGLSVGNNFRFSNFMFGFEWIGYLQTLSNTDHDETEAYENDTIDDARSVAREYVKLYSLGGLSYLWFRIGFGF
jgi:hypothetical protein